MKFTRSQQKIYDNLMELVTINYQELEKYPIRPQTNAIFLGPSGTGKSAIGKELARRNKAHYMRISAKSWIPMGYNEQTSTQVTVMLALVNHERVFLHIDELDKLQAGEKHRDWGASICNEIYDVTGKDINVDLLKDRKDCEHLKPEAIELIKKRIKQGLFIMGSGTWQVIAEDNNTKSLGFVDSNNHSDLISTYREKVKQGIDGFPTELKRRFKQPPLILDYPEQDEVEEILENAGVLKTLQKIGMTDIPEVDFKQGGMSQIECMVTDSITLEGRYDKYCRELDEEFDKMAIYISHYYKDLKTNYLSKDLEFANEQIHIIEEAHKKRLENLESSKIKKIHEFQQQLTQKWRDIYEPNRELQGTSLSI